MTISNHTDLLGRNPFNDFWSYWVDASQRSILFLDTLRQRGEDYKNNQDRIAPHALKFDFELVLDAREFQRPVNYVLVRVKPPPSVSIDPTKRPFVVADPRAGHGPGIGGFKADSEIGVALRAGHPCYFIGFLPEPVIGQTILDIAEAEALFLERVNELHSDADGKPVVIGNCQAGWALAIVAALRPELFGPLILAGSPLSYWAGSRGQNPMRYTAGLLGGTWLTALISDLGQGRFDGAWLVSNFENLNPANTFWGKHYNLYAKIDTEAHRYLEFENWWGGHVRLNAQEMQYITDKLFVGNQLASGSLQSPTGMKIDLRNIRSPIVVFCSKGDNITPPAQALGWILDLYESVEEIQSQGQTIVYAVHESVGHLGIFVSGSVAVKEHTEFASNIDLIDVMPPGLYEAVLVAKNAADPLAEFVANDYILRFEERTLDDIRAFGCNSEFDDKCFASVDRVSQINLGLYRTFWQPWVRLCSSSGLSHMMSVGQPARLPYELFSQPTPALQSVAKLADLSRANRVVVDQDNVFWSTQQNVSEWIEVLLDSYRDARDQLSEAMFYSIYSSPLIQALAGFAGEDDQFHRAPGTDLRRRMLMEERFRQLASEIELGGARDALIRALLYIRLPDGLGDERSFNLFRRLREQTGAKLPLSSFKEIVRKQSFLLLRDEREAIRSLPAMIEKDRHSARHLRTGFRRLVEALPPRSETSKRRLAEVEALIERALSQAANDEPSADASRPSGGISAAR